MQVVCKAEPLKLKRRPPPEGRSRHVLRSRHDHGRLTQVADHVRQRGGDVVAVDVEELGRGQRGQHVAALVELGVAAHRVLVGRVLVAVVDQRVAVPLEREQGDDRQRGGRHARLGQETELARVDLELLLVGDPLGERVARVVVVLQEVLQHRDARDVAEATLTRGELDGAVGCEDGHRWPFGSVSCSKISQSLRTMECVRRLTRM